MKDTDLPRLHKPRHTLAATTHVFFEAGTGFQSVLDGSRSLLFDYREKTRLGKQVGIERLGWHTFRHSYRSMLDTCGAPIGVQQKLMRHAQVSTTMKYGNAYMTEKRKAHGAVVQMVLPAQSNEKAEARSASA
jgi:integrase